MTVKKDSGKDVMVEELGLRNGSVVFVKDLGVEINKPHNVHSQLGHVVNVQFHTSGPQIGWRTVFVIEYLGPLVLHPLVFFLLRPYIYLNSALNPLSYIPIFTTYNSTDVLPPPTSTQALLCLLITLNFVKREIETLFVHRFSASTMPFSYVFRNSAHYWILCGIYMSIFLYVPAASTAAGWWPKALLPENNSVVTYVAVAVWVFAQVSNFMTHMTLRRLRPAGSKKRAIPTGYGFDAVTCPNYSFEVLGWVAITILSGGNWSSLVFTAVGGFTMLRWAQKKERRYRKEFGGAYRKKNVMIPGIL